MDIIDDFFRAKQAIYDHVGFNEDFVFYPLDDCREMYWFVDDESVFYAEKKENLSTDECYQEEIYTQRFYNKWVYRGEKYTMIFCHPHVDGMKYFRIFDNDKEM